MSKRTPAGDKGTADRIEADDGGYWVRLVTKQALLREGECMQNCLRDGAKGMLVGNEDTICNALWSLRKRCGTSYALIDVGVHGTACQVWQIRGPHNHDPSPWSVRQVRHLGALFEAAGYELWLDPKMVLVGPDGMTYRPDKAPADVLAAAEAERIEHERRVTERQAAYRHEAQSSLGSMPVRLTVLDEVDDYRDAVTAAYRTGLGVDTQPPALSVVSWADTNLPIRSKAQRGTYESFVSSALHHLAACVDLPYEEFTRDWRDVSEASERARLTQRIRDRGLIITTPPTDRASAFPGLSALRSLALRPPHYEPLRSPTSPGDRA